MKEKIMANELNAYAYASNKKAEQGLLKQPSLSTKEMEEQAIRIMKLSNSLLKKED